MGEHHTAGSRRQRLAKFAHIAEKEEWAAEHNRGGLRRRARRRRFRDVGRDFEGDRTCGRCRGRAPAPHPPDRKPNRRPIRGKRAAPGAVE